MTDPTDNTRPDVEHELKVWPPFFDALADGSKTFEVRKDDRGIQSGDLLRLREWQHFDGGAVFSVKVGDYTGRQTTARVGYVLRDEDAHEFGVQPGFCVLALLPAPPARPTENLGSAHPAPHPQGGTEALRVQIDELRSAHIERHTAMLGGRTYCACGAPWPCRHAAPAPTENAETQALSDVSAERQRQITKGYTPEHDDEHTLRAILGYGGLKWAPAYYANPAQARRELVRMSACLVAGIEWLDRRALLAAAPAPTE